MNGTRRYDYAMINFVSDNGNETTCPCMILGFIRYDQTLGIPTPKFINEDGMTLDRIQQYMYTDNSLYAVVHSASDYLPLEQLQQEFVSSFVLGDVMTCVYIVNVETIRCPLNVFKDYGAHGENVTKLFCTLPKREWGQYFSSRIV